MNQKKADLGFASLIFLLVGLGILTLFALLILNRTSSQVSEVKESLQKVQEFKQDQKDDYESQLEGTVDFTASFEIYTKGTKRIFTDPKYHNLSPDVYITTPDPSIIYVKKEGVSWSDFFKTLPMQLSKDCLVTGTMQTFCTGEEGILRFFIDGQENRDPLDLKIESGDDLKVTYE